MRILQNIRVQFRRGFGQENDADVALTQLGRGGPLQKRDESRPFIRGRARFVRGRNDLFRKIEDQRDPVFCFIRIRFAEKKAAE